MLVAAVNRVIIKPDDVSKTAGGLFVPQTAGQDVVTGRIVVGPSTYVWGGTVLDFPFKENDRVVFSQLGAITSPAVGEGLLVVRAEDVFARVEKG